MSLLTGLIFRLENGTISFSCLIPSSWGSMGCMELEQPLALCRRGEVGEPNRGSWP